MVGVHSIDVNLYNKYILVKTGAPVLSGLPLDLFFFF